MITFTLNPKRDKLPISRHPWVFSGAIKSRSGTPENGEVVCVETCKNEFIAYAHYSEKSKLQLRLLEWNKSIVIDKNWWLRKFRQAFAARKLLWEENNTTAMRLVFGENDFLPGLIVDKFDKYLVVQCATAGMVRDKQILLESMVEIHQEVFGELFGVVERSDSDGCSLEGLDPHSGIIYGKLPDNGTVDIFENGHRFSVNLIDGQKTGFYADQRENRQIVSEWFKGRTVLDICSYTGAFSIYSLANSAKSATLVDVSDTALKQAELNLNANNLSNFEIIQENAFAFLRQARKKNDAHWDAIVLDPPKLVPTRNDMVNGLRGYKDLNFQALSILKPGDLLATFSCSGLVSLEKFREMVIFAAKDAGKQVKIIRYLHQASCHPIRFSFPEGEYLKGLLVQVCES